MSQNFVFGQITYSQIYLEKKKKRQLFFALSVLQKENTLFYDKSLFHPASKHLF